MRLPIRYLAIVLESFRQRGVVPTLRLLVSEVMFDLTRGTETFRLTTLDELGDAPERTKAQGANYQAANARIFNGVMASLRRRFERDTFLDFGSGKGRALLLAAELGFREAIGVEFSHKLCEIARENVRAFRRKHPENRTAIDIVHSDAAVYPIPNVANVFFFFNPFREPVLGQVIARVVESLRRHPREHFIVYMNATDPGAFERRGFVSIDTDGNHRGTSWDGAMVFRLPPHREVSDSESAGTRSLCRGRPA